MLKVLKAIAEQKDMTLGDLLEGIVLHAFDGKAPFSPQTLKEIEQFKSPLRHDVEIRRQPSFEGAEALNAPSNRETRQRRGREVVLRGRRHLAPSTLTGPGTRGYNSLSPFTCPEGLPDESDRNQ